MSHTPCTLSTQPTTKTPTSQHLSTLSTLLSSKKILYLTEIGSKCMNLHAFNSDIDIRFIYVEHLDWYLKVHQPMSHGRTKNVNMHGEVRYKIPAEESPIGVEIDLVGYELRRVLNLISESNPTIFEWLRSKEVRFSHVDTREQFLAFMNKTLCKRKMAMYFYETGRGNLVQYITGNHNQKALVNRKKYIYILMNFFSVVYMQKNALEMPPMVFEELLEAVSPLFPDDEDKEREIQATIAELVRRKREAAGQWVKESHLDIIEEWIASVREPLKEFAIKIPLREQEWDWEELDQYFRNIVLKEYETMQDSYDLIVESYNLAR